jgi:integrase
MMENVLSITNAVPQDLFESLDVSESTRREYRFYSQQFINFLADRQFSVDSFLEYKRYLASKNDLSVSSKNKYLTTARILLKELNRRGLLPMDITQNIKSFKQSRRHKRTGLVEEEVSKLVKAINALPEDRSTYRLKAIIALMILQGLRQCEITRLNVSDVDLVHGLLFVRGKGRDDVEAVYMHPESVIAVRKYLKYTRIADGALFVSWSNNNRNQRITTKSLRRMVKDTLMALEIPKTVHGFRHYFTTTLLKEYGGDLLQVARYTRHKSLSMLQVYDDSIKEAADLPRYYRTFDSVKIV